MSTLKTLMSPIQIIVIFLLIGLSLAESSYVGIERDLPLSIIVTEFVPEDWDVEIASSIDLETSISWQESLHWKDSLKQGLTCVGLVAIFNSKTVVIQKYESDKTNEKSQLCNEISDLKRSLPNETSANNADSKQQNSSPSSKQGGFILVPLKQQQKEASTLEKQQKISIIPKLKPKRTITQIQNESPSNDLNNEEKKIANSIPLPVSSKANSNESDTQSKLGLASGQDNDSQAKKTNKSTSSSSVLTSSTQGDQNYLKEIHESRIHPQKYQVTIGNKLTNTLNEWAKQENWLVSWNSNYDYLINANATFDGDIIQASKSLLKSMGRTEPQFFIKFYRGNKLMIISDSTQNNSN